MLMRSDHFGRVLGLGVDAQLSELTGQIVLRGLPVVPDGLAESDLDWHVFVNGVRVAVQDVGSPVFLDLGGEAIHAQVEVLGVLRDVGADEFASSNLFYAYPVGSRIVLEWTGKPTEDDFDAYLIYYNEGSGEPTTLLAEIAELDTLSYVVAGLDAGAYAFKILYRDRAGNIGNGASGDLGLTATATTNPPPSPPQSLVVSCVDRAINASLVAPVSTTGIAGYYWAVNQTPEYGELPYCETSPERCVFVDVGGDTDLVFPAFAGRWQVGCYAVTELGVASALVVEDFYLLEDGEGNLVMDDAAKPSLIVDLLAESLAGAEIQLSWTSDIEANGGHDVFRGESPDGPWDYFIGAVVDSNTTQDGQRFVFVDDHSNLVDGTVYWYRVRGWNVGVTGNDPLYGEFCAPVEAMADATPPSGDQVLTARAVL